MSTTDFFPTLQRLCSDGESGTLFLLTRENRQVRIGIEQGRITALSMLPFKGLAAIQALMLTTITSVRFQSQMVSPGRDELPGTETILNLLSAGGEAAPAAASAASSAAAAPAPASAAASADAAGSWSPPKLSDEVLRIVEHEMAEYLGPIASLLVEEQAGKFVSAESLINALLPNFSDYNEGIAFAKKVRQRLSGK